MAVIRKTLNFSAQTPQNPWVAIPAGYTKVTGSDDSQINNRGTVVWELATGATALLRDDTVLTGRYRCAEFAAGPFPSMTSSAGSALIDASNDGICVVTNSSNNNYRIFSIIDGQMNTAQLWTSTGAVYAPDVVVRLIYDTVDQVYRVYVNGVQVFATGSVVYASATYTPIYAAAISRFGWLIELTSEYETAVSIDTLTSPLVPNSVFSGTATGFANGAATLTVGGVAIPVTVIDDAFSGVCPMLAEGFNWPRLPAAGLTANLVQGELSASTTASVTLPAGYNTLRDTDDSTGIVANFSDVITSDPKLLGYWFNQAGNPLTEDMTCYFETENGLWIFRNGDIQANTNSLPRTFTMYVQDSENDGVISEHSVTLNAAGEVVEVGGLIARGLTMTGLTMRGLTMTGL